MVAFFSMPLLRSRWAWIPSPVQRHGCLAQALDQLQERRAAIGIDIVLVFETVVIEHQLRIGCMTPGRIERQSDVVRPVCAVESVAAQTLPVPGLGVDEPVDDVPLPDGRITRHQPPEMVLHEAPVAVAAHLSLDPVGRALVPKQRVAVNLHAVRGGEADQLVDRLEPEPAAPVLDRIPFEMDFRRDPAAMLDDLLAQLRIPLHILGADGGAEIASVQRRGGVERWRGSLGPVRKSGKQRGSRDNGHAGSRRRRVIICDTFCDSRKVSPGAINKILCRCVMNARESLPKARLVPVFAHV